MFNRYVADPVNYAANWADSPSRSVPHPDYLSSSRKRLAPQLLFKGGILHNWGRKMAVAVQRSFFATLPHLERTSLEDGQLAWLVYDLERNTERNQYDLVLSEVVYTRFNEALAAITVPSAGDEGLFFRELQKRVRARRTPPDIREVAPPYDVSNA